MSILLFYSCTSTSQQPETEMPETVHVPPAAKDSPQWLWDSRPGNGELVFVAAGPRMGNRDDEIYSALENAAVQAGTFAGFWGASQDLVLSDVQGTSFNTRTHAYYNGPAADEALQKMDADKIWRNGEATWVRFILTDGPSIPPVNWTPDYIGGSPSWIHKIPEIPGWRVSVGMGGYQSSLLKTIKKADASALAAMLDLLHGANRSITQSVEAGSETWHYSNSNQSTYDRGFGDVYGFLVIARWLDEEGNGWSLAICPEKENQIQ